MNQEVITRYASPLSADAPCGENLEYDARMASLEEAYAGEPERAMGDSVIPASPPDWRKVEKSAAALMQETRDLRIVVIWTMARLANAGISGLCEGLSLIHALSVSMWDIVWPVPDDGDVQERISALSLLSPAPGSFDADTTVLHLLMDTKLADSPMLGAYSLKDVHEAADGSDAARTITAALRNTAEEHTAALNRELNAALSLLKDIRDCYAEHNQGTPDFTMMRDLLKEMQLFLSSQPEAASAPAAAPAAGESAEAQPREAAAAVAAVAQPVAGGAPMAFALPAPGNVLATRQELVNLMQQICRWFEENEPSSPVPYFLRRAIRSVGSSLVDILADIAPSAMDQVNNILKPALKDQTAAPGAGSAQPAAPPAAPAAPPSQEIFSPFG